MSMGLEAEEKSVWCAVNGQQEILRYSVISVDLEVQGKSVAFVDDGPQETPLWYAMSIRGYV